MRRAPSVLLVLTLLGAPAARADDPRLDRLREQRAASRDPAERAKIAAKMGEVLLTNLAGHYRQNDLAGGEQLLGDYLALIRDAHQELMNSGRDARQKPAGFKQLEIHLRQGLRQLDDVARALPVEDRRPLEDAMREMSFLRRQLLQALMKSQPPPQDRPPKEPPS